MGKETGFLDFTRVENNTIAPKSRLENFKEFHTQISEKERQEQSSRCMNCGVPMCQSAIKLAGMVTGCPLNNFIPEWNDAISKGQYELASWRLLKTSSFPEFTGRVCPALCEKACNNSNPICGSESVTIHDNELFIIETAFEKGYMKPQIPFKRTDKKIAVIGSGPAGLAVADLLNRRGHNVTVYEKEDRLGGLLMYGIPNMKLEKQIIDRRIDLMTKEGVTFITNADVGNNVTAKEILDNFDAVALCCGAKEPRPLDAAKALPKETTGVMYAVDFLTSVTKSLLNSQLEDKKFFDVKGKNVIIVGGGDTGNDCTGTCIRLGADSVTQIEMMKCPPEKRAENNPWPQWPKVLKTDYGAEESIDKFGHDPRIYETTIKEIITKDNKVKAVKTVQVEFKVVDGKPQLVEKPGTEKELKADLILIAAGFIGCQNYTAKAFDIQLSQRNTVVTENPEVYATAKQKIFTAGDMHRGQSLVVWAIAEGRECAKEIDKFLMGYTNL